MKFTRRDATKLLALPIIFHAVGSSTSKATAAVPKDPAFREAVQAAMLEYIDAAKIKGHSLIFCPIAGDFKENDALIVRNSIHLRWIGVRCDLAKGLQTDNVLADFTALSDSPMR